MPPTSAASQLRARWASWREGRMLGPVLTLVTGSVVAQGLVFAAQPVLTRLFLPEAFGILTVVTTTIAVLSTVASGGYRAAILLPGDDGERANLLTLTLAVSAASTALVLLGVSAVVGAGVVDEAMALGLWWIAPGLLLTEVVAAADTWHTGQARFRAVSWGRVAQSVVAVGVRLGVGLTVAQASDWSAGGLVGGAVAGLAAGALVSGGWLVVADGAQRAAVRLGEIRRLARRYVRFPSFSAPAALLNVASTRVPVFALVAFYGEAVVGQFGLAYGTLALPLGLVGGAVGQAFFPEASAARHDGRLGALTRSTARGLWAITAYPALAAAAAGPTLFAFVFGAEWAEAGAFAQRIAPWILLASVAPPLTAVFDVLERQRDELAISVLMFVVQTAAMIAAGLMLAPPEAVLVAGLTGALLRALHLAWIFRAAGVPLARASGDALGMLLRAAPFALAVLAADRLGASGAAVFVVAVLAGLGALGWTGLRARASHAGPEGTEI